MSATDPRSLRTDQYATGTNLSARIELHQRFTTAAVRWHPWLIERMPIREHARVLELGCGTGLFWREIEDRIDPSWRLTLTDFSEGMVREARRATSSAPCSVEGAVADILGIPVRDASIDAIVAKHMLYHVPDLDGALAEVRRVLRPDGVLYATTIGRDCLHEIDDVVTQALRMRRRCAPV